VSGLMLNDIGLDCQVTISFIVWKTIGQQLGITTQNPNSGHRVAMFCSGCRCQKTPNTIKKDFMKIELKNKNKIIPYKLNAKKHPQRQIESIIKSIEKFGFTQPIVTDKNGVVIIGHGRLYAAQQMNDVDLVPVLVMKDLNDQEARVLRLLDNRISETGWDKGLLAEELQGIKEHLDFFGLDFDSVMDKFEPDDSMKPTELPDSEIEGNDDRNGSFIFNYRNQEEKLEWLKRFGLPDDFDKVVISMGDFTDENCVS
jgi:hypothetical protein